MGKALANIATGGLIVGNSMNQADALKEGTSSQIDSANQATALQRDALNQARSDNMPALDARNASLQRMRELLGISTEKTASGYGSLSGPVSAGDVQNETGYQFGLNQGLKAQSNMLGARGMRNSGAALKAAARYGTDYATVKYDNAFNRELQNRNAQLNPLQSVAGLGQTGASAITQAGQNYANQAGNNALQIGNAQATNSIGNANIWANSLNQGVSLGKSMFGF